MPSGRSLSRLSSIPSTVLLGLLLVPAGGAAAQEPSATPAAVTSPAPMASVVPSAPSDIVFYPLPTSVTTIAPDMQTVSVEPTSTESLEIGQPIEFSLGHCGLWSPIDLDGSLWQADGGVTPTGAAIAGDDDAVIGELINETPGTFVIVSEDAAHFTTVNGTILSLARAPGAVDFPLCM